MYLLNLLQSESKCFRFRNPNPGFDQSFSFHRNRNLNRVGFGISSTRIKMEWKKGPTTERKLKYKLQYLPNVQSPSIHTPLQSSPVSPCSLTPLSHFASLTASDTSHFASLTASDTHGYSGSFSLALLVSGIRAQISDWCPGSVPRDNESGFTARLS